MPRFHVELSIEAKEVFEIVAKNQDEAVEMLKDRYHAGEVGSLDDFVLRDAKFNVIKP